MKINFTYWAEPDGHFLGFLNDYPSHWTQGGDLEDLKGHLQDLFKTFSGEVIPGIRS
ncbi:MAG: type II toxin-antitoxin system HicB family antitoxin [Verrucomicrobia bacterium]|nr:type II toxin-antitoxin system HicB family antitoxin [Verrucomicrobiota bacterium]